MDKNGKIVKEEPYVTNYELKDLKEVDFILQPAAFWTREVFEKIGYLEESYQWAFDWEYWLRCAEKFQLDFFNELTALNRYHPDMKVLTGGLNRKKEILELLRKKGKLTKRAMQINQIPETLIN